MVLATELGRLALAEVSSSTSALQQSKFNRLSIRTRLRSRGRFVVTLCGMVG